MSARRLSVALMALAVLGIAASAHVSGDATAPPRRSVYPKEFPTGDGLDLLTSKCQTCHSAMLVTQQRKDSTGWEKTVTTMEKWGARLVPADHAMVVHYLLQHFGPAKP